MVVPLWMLAGILKLLILREWVKDIQDMEGDRVAHHYTMAMRRRRKIA